MELTRRQALAALAGLGGAAALRVRAGELDGITGSIVGASQRRGHRVRDGFRPVARKRQTTGVAILGGGIAGLSAAWALDRAGLHDYLVLELESAPGGTARSGRNEVSAYPWAAHYVPVPSPQNRPLVALLEEVGAVTGRDAAGRPVYAEDMLCRDPQERVFFRGQWYEGLYPRVGAPPEELRQLRRFEQITARWAAWRDAHGRRAFDLPRWRGSDADEVRALDRGSMAEWLKEQGLDSPRLRWFVEYGCRDDFGSTLGQTSAWAGLHYFAARQDESTHEGAEFLTWPEGNGRLVAHLVQRAGNRVRPAATVTEVEPRPEGVRVVWFDEQLQEPFELLAEQAVCALPRFVARHLVAPWRASKPAFLEDTVYVPWVVANLTLRDRPRGRGFPLSWDNVLYDSPALGYVVATHQAGRDQGPTVLTWYLAVLDDDPKKARERLLKATWEEWVAMILADLRPAHPGLRELVERVDVMVWGHAMVRPRPGFMWGPALPASAAPLGRLHFAHTDLSGMALFEEAQAWGVKAAEAVLRQRGQRFTSWLD